jgi:uncharacterized repeat protein (TIGR02543 family)
VLSDTTTYQSGDSYTVASNDVTFTAQWSAINYNVTYNLNDFSGGVAPIETAKNIGDTFTVKAAPIRAGYTFTNWSDGARTYFAGDTYTVASNDVTLTAQWSAINYSITYDLNGFAGVAPTEGTKNIGNIFAVKAAPIRTGYTFSGWLSGGVTYQAGDSYTVSSSDVTFLAQWQILSYSLSYDGNTNTSGSAPTGATQNYDSTIAVSDQGTLLKSEYSFIGWNTKADGSGTGYLIGGSYTFTENTTLYAQWSNIPTKSVTFKANGGVGADRVPRLWQTPQTGACRCGGRGSLL